MKRVIVYSDGMQTTEKYHGFLLEWAQEKTTFIVRPVGIVAEVKTGRVRVVPAQNIRMELRSEEQLSSVKL